MFKTMMAIALLAGASQVAAAPSAGQKARPTRVDVEQICRKALDWSDEARLADVSTQQKADREYQAYVGRLEMQIRDAQMDVDMGEFVRVACDIYVAGATDMSEWFAKQSKLARR